MKKAITVLLCVLIAAFALCGCKDRDRDLANKPVEDKGETSDITVSTTQPDEADIPKYDDDFSSYKKPAEVMDIDMSKSDPSTENIRFAFKDGKVSSYEYKFGDETMVISYTYSDGAAEVFAFKEGVLVADDVVELSDYDPKKGFTVIDGYFFKGFTAK